LKEVPLLFGRREKGAFPTPVNITDPSILGLSGKVLPFLGKVLPFFLFAKKIKKLKRAEILRSYKI
jgi:hypothetical protein